MLGHFGFSYVGLIYLLMLFLPNILWAKKLPKDYSPQKENKLLVVIERIREVLCTCTALCFSDFNLAPLSPWSAWLAASFCLMLLYEFSWLRYFKSPRTNEDFYRRLGFLPIPLAVLPVAAFFLLGIYGRVVWLMLSALILGVGHIGVHLCHVREIRGR